LTHYKGKKKKKKETLKASQSKSFYSPYKNHRIGAFPLALTYIGEKRTSLGKKSVMLLETYWGTY
jgi:hypothetical protein